MSNLFLKNKKNNKNTNIISLNANEEIDRYKHFPVSTREWNNSIYSFNKNTLSIIPLSSKTSYKFIRDYLKGSNLDIKYKLPNSFLTRKQKRLTSNRIYVSNGEFKHTNDKVIIVLYTYNREKYNYLNILSSKYLFFITNKDKFNKKFYLIKKASVNYLKKIDIKKYNIIEKIKKNNINLHLINFYIKWIKKSIKIIKTYLYIKQLLYINNLKYNYTYLQLLKNYLEKIHNKKVEFNIINIKYNYLNSDILLKSVTLKITKNRKLNKLYLNIPTWKIEAFKSYKSHENNYINSNNININEPIENILNNKLKSYDDLKNTVLETIKYKRVSGIRLQTAGRLTVRIKSSMTVKNTKYKGNLKDKTKSKNLSRIVLRGNLKSNLQYTKLKSKTRVGSFGIKGWISGN